MRFRFISILFLIAFFSCEQKIIVPDTLKTAFDYLDHNWNDEQRLVFNTMENKEYAPVYYGYEIEEDLQGYLLKNHNASEQLNLFFDSLGIYRAKDKSGLILNTYFNYINDKPIDLQNQVNIIKGYWQPIEECDKQIKANALNTYTSFDINDTIMICLPVEEHNNAIDYNCPNYLWDFKEGRDLKITASLLDKSIEIDSSNALFKLKLLSKSNMYTEILCQEIYKGDTFSISLFNAWKISDPEKIDETETNNL